MAKARDKRILPRLRDVEPEEMVLPFRVVYPLFEGGSAQFVCFAELVSYREGEEAKYRLIRDDTTEVLTYDQLRQRQEKGALAELMRNNGDMKMQDLLNLGRRQIGAKREGYVKELIAEMVEANQITLRGGQKTSIDRYLQKRK